MLQLRRLANNEQSVNHMILREGGGPLRSGRPFSFRLFIVGIACAVSACDSADEPPGPDPITPDEARALEEAAEMLDTRPTAENTLAENPPETMMQESAE